MRLRFAALLASLILLVYDARADNSLQPESRFRSVDAFIAAVNAFEPSRASNFLAYLFSSTELGQPEDPKTGSITRADKIASCKEMWSDQNQALVFATANPPIEATQSCVGVLFLLESNAGQWRIIDQRVFHASGKYAEVDCKLSSQAGTGYEISADTVVVIVSEGQGGRGLSYDLSGSYRIVRNKLLSVELE
jgi:hypothetical protein